MKLPWSKEKQYLYTEHSAPITNGILRNGKGAALTGAAYRCSRQGEDRRVTFSLPRTASQMSLAEIRAIMAQSGGIVEWPNDSRSQSMNQSRSSNEDNVRRRQKNSTDKSKKNKSGARRRRRLSLLLDEKIAAKMRGADEEQTGCPSTSSSSRGSAASSHRRKKSCGDVPRRRRLSLLLDEKIAAKMRAEQDLQSRRSSDPIH